MIDHLSRVAVEMLGSLLPPDPLCAMVDFPVISNVGDNAIWLGERRALRMLNARLAYIGDMGGFRPERLCGHGERSVILLQGGGTLGDLWPEHQLFRERVMAAFPDHRVIQLPQSMNFRRPENLARARRVFNAHPDLVLLLRDQASLDLARNEFPRATCRLCPDMAFVLGPLSRRGAPRADIAILGRSDQERHPGRPALGEDDWIDEPTGRRGAMRRALRRLSRCRRGVASAANRFLHPYDLLARDRLAHGVAFLSRGRVVITDRLHGHILCLLLGIPHVLLNDAYNKIKSFYSTWTCSSDLVTWAEPHDEPLLLAAARLRTPPAAAGSERSEVLTDRASAQGQR